MIYELAGLRVNVKNRCRYTSEFCKEYLSEDQDSSADFEAETTKEEFYAEKEASPGFSDGYIENICLYRKICLKMPEYDRFLLHSAVSYDSTKGSANVDMVEELLYGAYKGLGNFKRR